MSESFTALQDKGMYYVDKTGFIPYLIRKGDEICVVTRPRRFGKTLMLRMLETYFEYRLDETGNPVDNRRYFDGLKVMNAGDDVLKEMGQYPVISLSFKGMRNDSLEEMTDKLRIALSLACDKHAYLLKELALSDSDRENFLKILSTKESQSELEEALGRLCDWIYKATNRKTVILIDEYDVPLQQAAIYDIHHPGANLFEKIVKLVGNFISSGFKSNSNLAYGIIVGCMRVAKESIFTGMNNPGVIDVTTILPDEYWGFTDAEVKQMMAYYDIEDKYPEIERWYDGYNFGGRKVFNPWSLLNAIRGLVNGYGEDAIQPYWVLTSGNDIIDDVIEHNPQHREIIEKMMNGKTARVKIYKNLSYRDLKQNPDGIWSFLLYTGYLKALNVSKDEDDLLEAEVTVPNTEVKTVIRSSLQNWWKNIKLRGWDAQKLLRALFLGDVDNAERELRLVLCESTSVFDYNEAFYHGMIVGLLGNVATVRSNDEYGEGRPDVVALAGDMGIVLEVKCVTPKALKVASIKDDDRAKIKSMMTTKLDEAEKQIRDNEYIEAVLEDEPIARTAKAYAVCFCKKWCVMREVCVD